MGQGDYNFDLAEGETLAPTPERLEALVETMRPGRFHLGRPGEDRKAWDSIAGHEIGRRILADADEDACRDPLPLITDAIYLDCLRDRSPAAMNAVAQDVRKRMALLPVAECLRPDGKFLERIEQDIDHSLRLRSWIHPNNDTEGDTFEERTIFNDLASVHTASLLVAANYLLGQRLRPETRAGIRREVRRRTLDPFRQRIDSGKDIYWWVTVTHNWNSVCLLHTVACALALEEDPRDRAWYVAVAEDLIRYSEEGFTDSGFYTEGVAYWAYGFGCYVTLAEIIRAVTGGATDWLQRPLVNRVSHFGRRMEIQSRTFPSFADCGRDLVLPAWLVHWMNNRIDDTRAQRSTATPVDNLTGHPFRSPLTALLILFHQVDVHHSYALEQGSGLREWWEDEQFLICRPRPGAALRLASTFKGGHNGVNHNHNDLGAFTVLIDDRELLVDPGAEIYTARTFSRHRYEGDLLNSFGHPVPVVAGQLQPPGADEYTKGIGTDVRARVVATCFSELEDRVTLDLREAYRVDSLRKLKRTFRHARAGNGCVEIRDEVEFSRSETFETALVTYSGWTLRPDGSVRIEDGDASLHVFVTSDHGELYFDHCVIDGSSTPTRLSWRLNGAIRAVITIRVTPSG